MSEGQCAKADKKFGAYLVNFGQYITNRFIHSLPQDTVLGFIYIDQSVPQGERPAPTPTKKSPSRSASRSSLDSAGGADDLEGQLMAFEEKWTILNEWNDGRAQTLREVAGAWKRMEEERSDLEGWMAETEGELKKMERSPTEEVKELTGQVHRIGVRLQTLHFRLSLDWMELHFSPLKKRLCVCLFASDLSLNWEKRT